MNPQVLTTLSEMNRMDRATTFEFHAKTLLTKIDVHDPRSLKRAVEFLGALEPAHATVFLKTFSNQLRSNRGSTSVDVETSNSDAYAVYAAILHNADESTRSAAAAVLADNFRPIDRKGVLCVSSGLLWCRPCSLCSLSFHLTRWSLWAVLMLINMPIHTQAAIWRLAPPRRPHFESKGGRRLCQRRCGGSPCDH